MILRSQWEAKRTPRKGANLLTSLCQVMAKANDPPSGLKLTGHLIQVRPAQRASVQEFTTLIQRRRPLLAELHLGRVGAGIC